MYFLYVAYFWRYSESEDCLTVQNHLKKSHSVSMLPSSCFMEIKKKCFGKMLWKQSGQTNHDVHEACDLNMIEAALERQQQICVNQ